MLIPAIDKLYRSLSRTCWEICQIRQWVHAYIPDNVQNAKRTSMEATCHDPEKEKNILISISQIIRSRGLRLQPKAHNTNRSCGENCLVSVPSLTLQPSILLLFALPKAVPGQITRITELPHCIGRVLSSYLSSAVLCTHLCILKMMFQLLDFLPLLDIDLLNLKNMWITWQILRPTQCHNISQSRHWEFRTWTCVLTCSNFWPSSSRLFSASLARASNDSPFLTWSSKSLPSLSICSIVMFSYPLSVCFVAIFGVWTITVAA